MRVEPVGARVTTPQRGRRDLLRWVAAPADARGAPARAIQEVARHADVSTTERYMHLGPAATEDAIRLLDRLAKQPSSAQNLGNMVTTFRAESVSDCEEVR